MSIKKITSKKKKKPKKRKKRKRKEEAGNTCPVNKIYIYIYIYIKEAGNVGKKKSVKKSNLDEGAIILGHFCLKMMSNFSLQFSLHFGENFLVNQERKHMSSTIYFPSSPPNQTHSKKVFLLIFSPKFSIHPISLSNKYTLKLHSFYIYQPLSMHSHACSKALLLFWEKIN